MNFLLANWKAIAAFSLAIALLFGAYRHGVDTTTTKYELQIADKELADAKALDKMRRENAATTKILQGEKHAAQKRIDDLAADNKRLRVLLPGCGRVVPVPNDPANPSGGDIQTAAEGKLLPGAPEDPQRALDEFMAGADSAFQEADTVVNECRVVYEWAKSLCKFNNSCIETK